MHCAPVLNSFALCFGPKDNQVCHNIKAFQSFDQCQSLRPLIATKVQKCTNPQGECAALPRASQHCCFAKNTVEWKKLAKMQSLKYSTRQPRFVADTIAAPGVYPTTFAPLCAGLKPLPASRFHARQYSAFYDKERLLAPGRVFGCCLLFAVTLV